MAPLNICLIGHRGVGKTTFLERLRTFDPARETYDLDREIARAAGRGVDEIFAAEGEAGFRAREAAMLGELLARPGAKVIAIGAGYPGPKPDALLVWLRRSTDPAGRVFQNRPRLNPAVAPLAEYLERFAGRETLYAEWADLTLLLPEGYDGGLEDILQLNWRVPFDVTLTPRAAARWPEFTRWRGAWDWRRLEVRDDLIAREPEPAPKNLLRAYRTKDARPAGDVEEDWALELGPPPRAVAIVSAHAGDVTSAIARLAPFTDAIQKLAVEVKTFAELAAGHDWWRADPTRRAFLPRDERGRWRWYRSLFGPRMPLHFVREDEGSALDQPPLWQTRLQPPLGDVFAAVLGHPVEHSRTPIEHRAYFQAHARPVVAIDVREDEWDAAIPVLRDLGLRFAAVTAPLKTLAFELATRTTNEARDTGAANTLYFDGDEIWATNTDVLALERIARRLGTRGETWLWGGGGVKSSVTRAWPGLRAVSARVGAGDDATTAIELLIWAVGRAREHRPPPAGLRPRLVLDLNYADDSPGLEYAVARGLPYQSGLEMFKLQAEAQREFWTAREGSRAGQPIR